MKEWFEALFNLIVPCEGDVIPSVKLRYFTLRFSRGAERRRVSPRSGAVTLARPLVLYAGRGPFSLRVRRLIQLTINLN